MTESMSTSTSLCICNSDESLSLVIVDLRAVLIRLRALNDRSAVALDTGIVNNTCNMLYMQGYRSFVVALSVLLMLSGFSSAYRLHLIRQRSTSALKSSGATVKLYAVVISSTMVGVSN